MKKNLTPLFAVLSNDIRQRCLRLVATNGEMCVCEFVEALDIAQSSASKALCSLKAVGIVEDRRDKNWTYYYLARDLTPAVGQIVEATLAHLATLPECEQDQRRFRRVSNSRSREEVCA